jgi:hypothetical protein
MDSISTANALSLLTKWHDEASVVAFDHGQTGKSCKSWVLVREVISGKNPSVTFLMLHDPFPLRQLSLAKAEFEYGDHRGWSEGGKLVVEQAEERWVCFLVILHPSGQVFLLSEFRRETDVRDFVESETS